MKETTVNEPKSKTVNNAAIDVAKNDNKSVSQIVHMIVSQNVKPTAINFQYNNNVFTGFIEFSISLENLGITSNDILDIKNAMFFKQFFIRFVGEYILRNNLPDFMEAIVKERIDMSKCKKVVDLICSTTQITFGVQMNKKKTELCYSFHIKVLEEILGDEFRI